MVEETTGGIEDAAVATITPAATKRKRKKSSPVGRTKARKKRKTKTSTRVGKGCRAYVTRENIFSLLQTNEQKQMLRTEQTGRRSYPVFGTIKSGSARNGYEIEFDSYRSIKKK